VSKALFVNRKNEREHFHAITFSSHCADARNSWRLAMTMPFGRHKGLEIEELPDDYLRWLATRDLYGELHEAVLSELAWRSSFGPVEQNSGCDSLLRLDRADVGLVRVIIDRGF
jgi:uncharacterized protein (DUF3820 family)